MSVLGICIPSIKFRLSSLELKNIKRDRSYRMVGHDDEIACFTNQPISPLNIGVLGTIRNGLLHEAPERMTRNLNQVVLGIAQLALASYLAVVCVSMALPEMDLVTVITGLAGICLGFV